jgi:hypothetical protein
MTASCEHFNFAAMVNVHRLTKTDDGPVTGFMADIAIKCVDCGRQFQFLGLEPGLDTAGARVSIDGMEAHIAICPQGQQPSALDRIAVNFPTNRRH